jgi:glycosyltransferase involved in cell wall biosynthesis
MPLNIDSLIQSNFSLAAYANLQTGEVIQEAKKIGVRPRFKFDNQTLALPPIFVHAQRLFGIRGASPIVLEKMLREVSLDSLRTHFVGKLPYDQYIKVLQVSAAHVYLTYPFVLSWSLLEAITTGCAVVASNTAPVKEFLSEGPRSRLVDFFDVEQLKTAAIEMLESNKANVCVQPMGHRGSKSIQDVKSALRNHQRLMIY